MTDMNRSFDSWNSLNEGLFSKALAKGKDRLEQPGRDALLMYKVTDKNNFRYSMKNFNASEMYVKDHKLTDKGASLILQDLNGKAAFIATVGKLDKAFFETKMLIYTVKRESDRVLTIQFTVADRNVEDLNKMGLDPKVTLISTIEWESAKKSTGGINLDSKLEAAFNSNKAESEKPSSNKDLTSGDSAKGTSKAAEYVGKPFKYTMRTNGVTYTMEFNEKGAIDAKTDESGYVPAVISLEGDSSIMWFADNPKQDASTNDKNELLIDIEIVNSTDKQFLLKMFKDDKYRSEYLNKSSSSEVTGEYDKDSIKTILFNRKGELIFGDYSQVASASTEKDSSKTQDSNTDEYQQALDAGTAAAKREMEKRA